MKRFLRQLLGLAPAAAILAVAWWLFTRPDLLQAAPDSDQLSVVVETNVHVSSALPGDELEFCDAKADPNQLGLVVASALRWRGEDLDAVCFRSDDAGLTWSLSNEFLAPAGSRYSDLSLCFDRHGTVFLASMCSQLDNTAPLGTKGMSNVGVTASTDGARTWEPRGALDAFLDRPWLASGASAGLDSDDVYLVANADRAAAYRSSDGARSFDGPTFPQTSGPFANCRHAEPAIHGDGALSIVEFGRPSTRISWRRMYAYRSTDAGDSFEPMTPPPVRWRHPRLRHALSTRTFWPRLAAGRGAQDGWLYCVWGDGTTDGLDGERILFASSPDQGRSWIGPLVLSEQPMGPEPERDEYSAFKPSIAVAPDGTLGVSWYDRRGMTAPRSVPTATPNVSNVIEEGWKLRFRASVDGGASWSPSVLVSQAPSTGPIRVGHAAALAVAPDGTFLPVWIDNRTGHGQVWSARITVAATTPD